MSDPHLLAALILLATAILGLLRVLLWTGRVEKLLVLQLLGSSGVGVVLLLAHGLGLPGLQDLALVLAVLAATVAVAFIRFGGLEAEGKGHKS